MVFFLSKTLGSDIERICAVLEISSSNQLIVNGANTLIYKYIQENRFDTQFKIDDYDGKNNTLPILPLKAVDDSIVQGRHYVVTELLFTYTLDSWGALNWRAFIEQKTGSVLYLRALISCVTAKVLLNTADFDTLSPLPELNTCIETVTLFGLNKPLGGIQELKGEFVTLADCFPPDFIFPTQSSPYNFSYGIDTLNFAACSAYYHCDNLFRLMIKMGINVKTYFDDTCFPISVDPYMNKVNAYAEGNSKGTSVKNLSFGVVRENTTMGLAIDPRIVIHEFGHAILRDHIGCGSLGFAHSVGDSLAAILHDPYSKAEEGVTFPFLKSVGKFDLRRHDRKIDEGWAWFGREYDNGYRGEQILSTTLFNIYKAAGGYAQDLNEKEFASQYMTFLIFKAVSLLSFTTPHPEVFVGALTEADRTTGIFSGHPGGALSKIFRWAFEQQGLYHPVNVGPEPGPGTGPGDPPVIDVYIDDGRKGEYAPYSYDYDHCSSIWNRLIDDGQVGSQALQPGVPNYAYVKITNRGIKLPDTITVIGYQSLIVQPVNWPTDWQLIKEVISTLGWDKEKSAIVGPFEWIPRSAGDSLLFSVSASGDRSNVEIISAGPVLNKRLVTMDNNIAMRTFA